MHINDFPDEILSSILDYAAQMNADNGVKYTFGLTQAPLPISRTPLTRYIRGPVQPEAQRWDGASNLRGVCARWHDWAIRNTIRTVSIRRWQGSERWAEIPTRRSSYGAYEFMSKPRGSAVYRDPFGFLKSAVKFFSQFPDVAGEVRRMFFDGFNTVETDRMIFDVLRSCRHLTSVSVPWTLLRHGTAQDWIHLLGISSEDDVPLTSLELRATCLGSAQEKEWAEVENTHPLADPRVNFSQLKRLKIFGNTLLMPIDDEDMFNIARSANNLEEFHLTNLSTVTIAGVMAIVNSSANTLRVLEHSPRSDDGFFHPHPGYLSPDTHVCESLASCPRLKDLSISIPSMCACLFSHEEVVWEGECQVRALELCDRDGSADTVKDSLRAQQALKSHRLRDVLASARTLMQNQKRKRKELDIELFFADCIFDPAERVVHGDFSFAEVSSGGAWPMTWEPSAKGPYGSTGVYGKTESSWICVSEDELLRAVEKNWFRL
ncbi:hypothetical protein KCU76_g18319, partial [Aureobasidium melanogenum]